MFVSSAPAVYFSFNDPLAKMMAAAQAAAEAALKEAMEREQAEQEQLEQQLLEQQQQQGHHHHYDHHQYYEEHMGDDEAMDAAAAAAAMHHAELEQQQMMDQEDLQIIQALESMGGQLDMELLEEILSGRAGASPEVQQAILQMLAQQEQEQAMEQQLAQQAMNNRPDEHYLTVAQNGTCFSSVSGRAQDTWRTYIEPMTMTAFRGRSRNQTHVCPARKWAC